MEAMKCLKEALGIGLIALFFGCNFETRSAPSPGDESLQKHRQSASKNLISGYEIVYVLRDGAFSCFSQQYAPTIDFNHAKDLIFKSLEIPEPVHFTRGPSICGLTDDNKIACFRATKNDEKTLRNIRLKDNKLTNIFGKGDITCGIQKNGHLFCFIAKPDKKYDKGNPPGPYSDIAGTLSTICGIKLNHEVECTTVDGDHDSPDAHLIPIVDDPHTYLQGKKLTTLTVLPGLNLDSYCALDQDKRAQCFRLKTLANLKPPKPDTQWLVIAAPSRRIDTSYTCGIDVDGQIWCWEFRKNEDMFSEKMRSEKFISIASGEIVTCGIRQDRTKLCFENPYPGWEGCRLPEADFITRN